VANDGSDVAFSRGMAMPVGTAETLVEAGADGLKMSLKLYHPGELQLGYQQSIAEGPNKR
jgi:hypothetical protein